MRGELIGVVFSCYYSTWKVQYYRILAHRSNSVFVRVDTEYWMKDGWRDNNVAEAVTHSAVGTVVRRSDRVRPGPVQCAYKLQTARVYRGDVAENRLQFFPRFIIFTIIYYRQHSDSETWHSRSPPY